MFWAFKLSYDIFDLATFGVILWILWHFFLLSGHSDLIWKFSQFILVHFKQVLIKLPWKRIGITLISMLQLKIPLPRNSYCRGRIRTVDLLVLISSDDQLFILNLFFKTTQLNEEVKRTLTSPTVSVPCIYLWPLILDFKSGPGLSGWCWLVPA